MTCFRNYTPNTKVEETYKEMHAQQTVENVKKLQEKWYPLNHAELTIKEAIKLLDDVNDLSDPDLVDVPNSVHAYQTAEAIRKDYPDDKLLQLTGLIHDLGKIMIVLDPTHPQWATVGDTYPLGCKFSDKIVYSDSFVHCPDKRLACFNTKYGMYAPNCGLGKLLMSFGHDDYLAHVLTTNKNCKLPQRYTNIIRYHSFYAWHSCGEYEHLLRPEDELILNDIKTFNNYDLYSKNTKQFTEEEQQELEKYYNKLIDTYLPGKLNF